MPPPGTSGIEHLDNTAQWTVLPGGGILAAVAAFGLADAWCIADPALHLERSIS